MSKKDTLNEEKRDKKKDKKRKQDKNIKLGFVDYLFGFLISICFVCAIVCIFIKFDFNRIVSLCLLSLGIIFGAIYVFSIKDSYKNRKKYKEQLVNNFLNVLNVKLNARYVTTKNCILFCKDELYNYQNELDLIEKKEFSKISIFNKNNPYYDLLIRNLSDSLNEDKEIDKMFLKETIDNYLGNEKLKVKTQFRFSFVSVLLVCFVLFVFVLVNIFYKVVV